MKKGGLYILLGLVWAFPVLHARADVSHKEKAISSYMDSLVKDKDYLGLRIFLKAYAQKRQIPSLWKKSREILGAYPQIGADLLFGWKTLAPFPRSEVERDFQVRWDRAQKNMLQNKFSAAAVDLEQLVVQMRVRIAKPRADGAPADPSYVLLYPYLLHSLARAYFGKGSYQHALQLYEWIPSGYASFRQVLFERMWAAYRSGDHGKALAAIASQKSAYMSPYLEPEAYLIQIYVYKKLCRNSELQIVLKELESFRQQLEDGRFDLEKWSTADPETHSQFQLLQPRYLDSRNGISQQLRKQEMAVIVNRLRKAHARDVKRLRKEITKVVSLSGMAVLATVARHKAPMAVLPDRENLSRMGLEIWAYDRGEEWIDEIGSQSYMGETQCVSK